MHSLSALESCSITAQLKILLCRGPTECSSLNSKILIPDTIYFNFLSIQYSCSVVSDSLRPHGLQHARPPCPSPTPGVYSNSYPLSPWCHPAISSSVIPFSSCLKLFPTSGSFQVGQFFASGGQSIGVSASASVLPMNIQDWSPCSPRDSQESTPNTTVQKHQFFCAQLSL